MKFHWILIALISTACGKVQATSDAAAVGDGSCTSGPCLPDGQVCTAGSDCNSGQCACGNATCTAKLCSPVACACQVNTTGGAACDGYVSAGYDDAENTCGASACDGTGQCGDPLLWLKFDEAAMATTIANSGTWPGKVTSVAGTKGVLGVLGKALQLSTATDGVVIDDPADGSLDSFATWTVEGWIKLNALPLDGYATLVKKNGGYICRLVEGSAPCTNCYVVQSVVFTPSQQAVNWPMTTAPVVGTWYHLACTYGAGTLTVYWDGSRVMTMGGGTAPLANTPDAFGVGNGPLSTSGENLQGSIDDFKMWNTARTDRQICLDACGSYAGTTCTFDGICTN